MVVGGVGHNIIDLETKQNILSHYELVIIIRISCKNYLLVQVLENVVKYALKDNNRRLNVWMSRSENTLNLVAWIKYVCTGGCLVDGRIDITPRLVDT